MKTKSSKFDSATVLAKLALCAPSISIVTTWEHNPNCKWDGDGPSPARNAYKPYDVTVTATGINAGQLCTAHTYLGSCWSKEGKHCPEVHGYWLQMAEESVSELPEMTPCRSLALAILKEAIQASYAAQQKTA